MAKHKSRRPKIGSKIITWFSGQPDGKSTVLGAKPYQGKYPFWFKWDVKVTAPRCYQGWLEVCVGKEWVR